MTEESTFDTEEAVAKLKDITAYLPEYTGQPFMIEFCRNLGERLSHTTSILPVGFVMAVTLLVEDAKRGEDGFTGEPMARSLTGQHGMVYNLAWSLQTDIAKATFGQKFADLVAKELESLKKD